MLISFHGSFDLQKFFNSQWLHYGRANGAFLALGTRYWESQLSLVVTLWLSGVVGDLTFTLGGVDMRTIR